MRGSLPSLDVRSLPGVETVLRRRLDNGIVILARENFSSPSVFLSGYLNVGALDDPERKLGLADITASALMRGTEERDFREIYQAVESVGASIGVGAGTHYTSFGGNGLAEDLGLLLDILTDVLQHPSFPQGEVERLRGEKLAALAIREQDTGERAQQAFHELAYPNHPYSHPSDGTRESVEGLTRSDLCAFHGRFYSPEGMVLAVVGGVEAEAAVELAEQHLGRWQATRPEAVAEVPSPSPPPGLIRRDVRLAGKAQCDIVLGMPGPSRWHPDFLAASLGNSILGRFGLMGRIGDVVRESAGLAYYAYSNLIGGPGPGPWQVIAGVNPVNVDRAIELIRGEIKRFVTRRVTVEELSDSQANFIGRLPLQLETNDGVAGALVNAERYDLGLDYYQRYPGLVAEVTRDQVLRMARSFLDPDRLAIGVAGPVGGGGGM